MTDYQWTAESIELLREYILRGYSAAAIANEMPLANGVKPTRNAVLGKIHRAGLANRGPISYEWSEPAIAILRQLAPRHTKTEIARRLPLDSAGIRADYQMVKRKAKSLGVRLLDYSRLSLFEPKIANGPKPPRIRRAAPKKRFSVPRKTEPVLVMAYIQPIGLKQIWELGLNECRFPIGEPRSEEFGFCAEPTPIESSYCAHHHSICTTKITSAGGGWKNDPKRRAA
jgi:GcrA cell cycle regulator